LTVLAKRHLTIGATVRLHSHNVIENTTKITIISVVVGEPMYDTIPIKMGIEDTVAVIGPNQILLSPYLFRIDRAQSDLLFRASANTIVETEDTNNIPPPKVEL
jgi:hypothetical protein